LIIDDKRIITVDEKLLSRKVMLEKTPDGKESLKIIVEAAALQGKMANQRQKRLYAAAGTSPSNQTGGPTHDSISTCLFYKIYLLYISLNCLEHGPLGPDLYGEWADSW
jgi:hypothetical protein